MYLLNSANWKGDRELQISSYTQHSGPLSNKASLSPTATRDLGLYGLIRWIGLIVPQSDSNPRRKDRLLTSFLTSKRYNNCATQATT